MIRNGLLKEDVHDFDDYDEHPDEFEPAVESVEVNDGAEVQHSLDSIDRDLSLNFVDNFMILDKLREV